MKKAGLKWSHAQKKGVLTKSDLKLRLKFAWNFVESCQDFWFGGVGFYLDEASFTHKMSPFDHARAPRPIVWRKQIYMFIFVCV